MYFKYGTYQHDAGEITLANFTHQRMKSKRNRLMFTRYTMTLLGEICVSGQAAIKTKMNTIEDVYKNDYQDAALYHDDGVTSKHHMPNNGSINGVRVLSFDYPKGDKAEYATGRTYKIVLQADYMNAEDQIYHFSEMLTFIGNGGPQWELVPHFNDPPTSRVVYSSTPQRIIQRGSVIGLNGWPLLPTPIYAAQFEHMERRLVRHSNPLSLNRYYNLMYPLEYQYVFSSAIPLSGYPRQDY